MYFHICYLSGLTTLEPHQPTGFEYGEPNTPRVCAAPTIEQCIAALAPALPPFVYVIDQKPDVNNNEVVNWPGGGEVHDAVDTGEVWYLTPVPCREIARLEV